MNPEVETLFERVLKGMMLDSPPGALPALYRLREMASRPEAQAQNADVLAQVEAALRKNPLIAMFLDQSFWHAHHADIVIRYNGQDKRFEADWIKDIWYIVRRRGLSATEAVRAEQSEPPMNSGGTCPHGYKPENCGLCNTRLAPQRGGIENGQ